MAVSFTGTYVQNFDTLASSGTAIAWTNDATLAGWSLFRQPAPGTAVATIEAGAGTSNTGAFFSYGSAGSTERALGGQGSGGSYFGGPASGAVAGWIVFSAVNDSGATIDALTLRYDGEQWRNGGNASTQSMVLEYGFGAGLDTVAQWIAPGAAFDWSAPVVGTTAAAVDGNGAGRIDDVGGDLTGLDWNSGETLWLRWTERNDAGNDHGLALDDLSLSVAAAPVGDLQITEYLYSGANGEFIEFTNVGSAPIDLTGWSFDDDSAVAGTIDLSAFGVVAAGESVVLTESTAASFRAAWTLSGAVKVIGGLTANLGRADEINVFDASGTLIDRLTYGDERFPGTVRAQNASAWAPVDQLDAQAIDADWVLSAPGDAQGTRASTGGDLGSPGTFSTETSGGGGGSPTSTVNLAVSTTRAREVDATAITVTAVSSAPVAGPQTVTLSIGGAGITTGDYLIRSTSIVIPDGQTSGAVTLTISDDARREDTETMTLTIGSPSAGLALGATTTANVTIADHASSFLTRSGSAASATASEIPAFDPGSNRLYVVAASTVNVYAVDGTGALSALPSIATPFAVPAGTVAAPNSVAIRDGIVAVAYEIKDSTTGAHQNGKVVFLDAGTGAFLNAVDVGALPDMLTFSPDGRKVLVANEGEPNSYGAATSVDPEGSISIIDVSDGVAVARVATAGFGAFNDQMAALKADGVRIFGPGASVAQDLEPEYITVAPDGTTAVVTLQEANALAIVDIASATVTDLVPLGVKLHALPGQGLDASDRDVDGTSAGGGLEAIRTWPVAGLYQPDAIASYTVDGRTYLVTANEGDARDYAGFSEEARVGDAAYALDAATFPDTATLERAANLGRLTVTRATGDTDGDGDFDRIEAFGARSFTIWNADGTVVFDSGDQIERITAARTPLLFNSEGTVTGFDTRSDNKGPEPEGVVLGRIDGHTYAFIGLERTGDVMVWDVTRPSVPEFVQYINTPEDRAIEGLTFVSADDSPTGRPLLITAAETSNTVSVFEITPPTRIHHIQGAAHVSPLLGQGVTGVAGIVTALAANGFYLQDPYADGNDATSEGIFVFTGSGSPLLAARSVGEAVKVSGTVSEFRPGSNTNNLSVTQIGNNGAVQALEVVAWTAGEGLSIAPVALGRDRVPPAATIHDDAAGNVETTGDFDPTVEGIDFYESLEGMRVRIDEAVATSPTARFGTSEELWVLADGGAGASGTTARGGSLIAPGDFNPERIQIDDLQNAAVNLPDVDVGARLGPIEGVVGYDFGNYEVLVPSAPTVVAASSLTRETTHIVRDLDEVRIASFNVENLDPNDGPAKFAALAAAIVGNLKAPDILSLAEVQDNSGPLNDGVTDAGLTLQTLVDAIAAAGGPTYVWRQIDPVNNEDGGEPGGNIRVAFLYDPARVGFVEPSLRRLSDADPSDGDAFAASRKPLAGTFTFNGEEITVVANHFNSKGGDQPLFGRHQPPALASETQRLQQAEVVRSFVAEVLAEDAGARVVVAGDLNDFEFSDPITRLESAGLTALIETLPANERYGYNFEGNAQALDHLLASDRLVDGLAGVDIVHMNSEFAEQVSDHDPFLAAFLIARAGRTFDGSQARDVLWGTEGFDTMTGRGGSDHLSGGAGRDTIDGGVGADWIDGGAGRDTLTGGTGADRFVYTALADAGDTILDFNTSSDRIALGPLLQSLGYRGRTPVADGVLSLLQTADGVAVMVDADGSAGPQAAVELVELLDVELVGVLARHPQSIFEL